MNKEKLKEYKKSYESYKQNGNTFPVGVNGKDEITVLGAVNFYGGTVWFGKYKIRIDTRYDIESCEEHGNGVFAYNVDIQRKDIKEIGNIIKHFVFNGTLTEKGYNFSNIYYERFSVE